MEPEQVHDAATGVAEPAPPIEPAPPVHNRFLFVDIAAQRAKQLRRGARPRLEPAGTDPVPPAGHRADTPRKAERVAMEEVRRGLVYYTLPLAKDQGHEAQS
jgi:hypothetical protein